MQEEKHKVERSAIGHISIVSCSSVIYEYSHCRRCSNHALSGFYSAAKTLSAVAAAKVIQSSLAASQLPRYRFRGSPSREGVGTLACR